MSVGAQDFAEVLHFLRIPVYPMHAATETPRQPCARESLGNLHATRLGPDMRAPEQSGAYNFDEELGVILLREES